MNIVKPAIASAQAIKEESAWIELAWATASGLERWLGEPDIGDHLPGLGEIAGWGLSGDARAEGITGAIYTGFYPNSDNVSLNVSATCIGDKLAMSSLVALLDLPVGCLSRLTIRTLVSSGTVMRVFDRSELVLETRSARAVALGQQLVKSLVNGAVITVSEGIAQEGCPLHVIMNDRQGVSRVRMGKDQAGPGWLTISDWED